MNFSSLRTYIATFLVLSVVLPAFAAEKFYEADFKGWRDSRTDSGFNAKFERQGTKAAISVSSPFQFGKAMTPQEPVSMRVTPSLILQIVVDEIEEGGILSVEIVNAGPPYDGYKVLTEVTEPGTYNTNLGKATEWTGNRNFWIAVWLEGTGKEAEISALQIGENLAPVKSAEPAKNKPVSKKAAASAKPQGKEADAKRTQIDFRGDTTKDYKYFEDWSEGLGGWRDGTTNKGMNTKITVKKGGRINVKLEEKATYGKIMSKEKPLVVDFRKHPFLEIELERELELGQISVQLVQARNPDNNRVVIPRFSRPGVYIANIPEVAGWKKKEAFFIEIWMVGAGSEINIRSIGFSKKMSVLQGIMTPVQSVRAAELAPSKQADVLKVAGVADQTFRGQWLEGSATLPNWDEEDRYGKKLINHGFSEIAQKLYFILSIQPTDDVSIYGSIGYDLVNEFEGLLWEDPFARAIKAKIDAGLIKVYDFYIGNVAQIGTVYDPLFTDLTFKKASTFRGFMWKPQIGDFNFRLFGTRLATEVGIYKNSIYMTGLRAANNFTLAPGSIQLGFNAVNLAKTNGEMDSNSFQGKVEPEVYQSFAPSVYIRVENNTNVNMYYNAGHVNNLTINGSTGTIPAVFTPPGGNNFVSEEFRTYTEPEAKGINSGGHIVYRVPLLLDQETLMEPADIQNIAGNLAVGAWESATGSYYGTIDVYMSSDGQNWPATPLLSTNWTTQPPDPEGRVFASFSGSYLAGTGSAEIAALQNGVFDSTEGTLARSILSADISGQLFGVTVDAEYAVSLAHNQTFRGERTTHANNAFFVKLARGFSGALVQAAYFNIDADYDTSLGSYNSVDDNDNGTLLPDRYPDKGGVVFGDYSNRGVPDKEYVVGLYVPDDYLLTENEDRNHNGLLDSRENDHEPDYTYRRDQRGYDLSVYLPRQVLEGTDMENFEFEARGLMIERISRPGINQTIDAQLNYINTDIEDWYIKAGVYVASVIDQLSDQYQMYTSGGQDNKVEVKSSEDDEIPVSLDYLHNFVLTPSITVKYDAPWGLKATLVNRFRYNQSFFSDQGKQQGNEVNLDLRYRHYVMGGFSMTPIYQGRYNSRQANAASPIHNTYYLPVEHVGNDWQDIPMFHGFYLKNLYPILNEYNLAVDIGHELNLQTKRGMPDRIHDKLAVGLLRNLPRGYLRIQWEMNKVYFPYDNGENWGQSALWAQFTATF